MLYASVCQYFPQSFGQHLDILRGGGEPICWPLNANYPLLPLLRCNVDPYLVCLLIDFAQISQHSYILGIHGCTINLVCLL